MKLCVTQVQMNPKTKLE